ncbi:MAG TPA: 16S rRNA (adenine(1518)-N(6)/adenine(1519)-N(6))-dimethyltransferase RsmA [Actinopolymorphaceae bacterium]
MSEASDTDPGRSIRPPRAQLGPADIRALAARLQLRPSKQRGQTFVTDPNTVRRIVRASGVGPDDVVLEVGPGLGSLTLALLEVVQQVVAVEIDETLAAALPTTVARYAGDAAVDRLTVVHGDALDVTGALAHHRPSALVANLPYNVAVPVLLEVLAQVPSVDHGMVMVQLEVAERLTAPPGSRIYGAPTVKVAWYAQVRKAGHVSRTVFWPQPNVDSGLVAFVRRPPPATTASREDVFAVVDAAFGQRRKTLRSALAGLAGSSARAEEVLRAAGIEPSTRGERLDVSAFARIAEALQRVAGADEERKPSR